MEIIWKEFYLHPTTIHVWGNKPEKHRFYNVLKKLSNLQSQKGLFNRLATETDGDRALTINLCNAMSKLTAAAKKSGVDADDTKLGPICLSLTNSIMEPVSDLVDAIVKDRFRLSFGHFLSIPDPILSREEIDRMVNFTRTSIPQIWKLVQELLGYSDAYTKKDLTVIYTVKRHLAGKTYSRNTFYQIVALTRMRNGKHFSYWASIGALAAYAKFSIRNERTDSKLLRLDNKSDDSFSQLAPVLSNRHPVQDH
jgi:hypothetical protein